MEKGIAPNQVLPYFSQLLNAMEAAHLKGTFHRDLKPENILVTMDEQQLVVADFGIAHFEEEDLFTAIETKAQDRLANFIYAAPEQTRRGETVDHRADIYALGLILNELFTGSAPRGTGYKKISDISPEHAYLDGIVDLMLQDHAAARSASIETIKTQLIGRENEFINLQRVDQLHGTVIEAKSAEDDPLIADPIRIINFDWQNGRLDLIFNNTPNGKWILAFQNMGSHSAVNDKGPERWIFSGNKASISAEDRDVQRLIDHFKGWLPQVHNRYVESIRHELMEAERKMKEKLQMEIKELESRNKLLQTIKI